MIKDHLWYPAIVVILTIVLVIPVLQYYVFVPEPWEGMNCDEMFDFAMAPEHKELTMDQHMAFHQLYNPCLEDKNLNDVPAIID